MLFFRIALMISAIQKINRVSLILLMEIRDKYKALIQEKGMDGERLSGLSAVLHLLLFDQEGNTYCVFGLYGFYDLPKLFILGRCYAPVQF